MIEPPAVPEGVASPFPDAVAARLSSGETTFGVVGLGYVGLPLAVQAAGRGISVLGFDVDAGVVEGVNRGRSHISDLTDEQVAGARRSGALEATADMSRLGECHAISICVPTPLSRTRDPDITHILAATEGRGGVARSGTADRT